MHLRVSKKWRIPGTLRRSATDWILAGARRLPVGWDSIRERLVLLALVATAPLLILTVVNTFQDLATARQDAQMEALRVAQLHANLIDEHIQAIDALLSALSKVSTESADPQTNEALLRAVAAELPVPFTGLFLGPPTGQVHDQATSELILSRLPISPATGVVLGRPVMGRDGRVAAILYASTRLDRLPRLETRDLPQGSVILILDERGVVLAHTPDYDVWVGRDLSDLAYVQQALRQRQGSGELVGADGVTRLSAYTSTARVPWLVYVGLPSEIVLGSSRVALLRNLWLGLLAMGAAVLLAWFIAGRITAPMRRLAADAAALGRGDLARRTHPAGRDEMSVLAAVFNQMADDVERHVADVRASHIGERDARLAAEAAKKQIAEREQRLQDLVRRLQVAQEEERRRVAYEIHDGLAQVAASAHQHLQTYADYHTPETSSEREALGRTVELVQRTVREARRVIAGLRPMALDDFGLATAIRLEVEALRGEGWQVTYDERLGARRLQSTTETALFRVAQEALTNVRKHAGPARVAVTIEELDEVVRLEVRDWGRGIGAASPQDRLRPGERFGLIGMQERVALLGGHCTVLSQRGSGTRVIAEVPLAARAPSGGVDGV